MKKSQLFVAAGLAALVCTSAHAEVYPKDKLITMTKTIGHGPIAAEYSFTRDKAKSDQAIKEIGWLTIQPGDGVGYHKHEKNEDAYIIVSGEGTFKDTDGKETAVKAGDITIVRKGESHSLMNTGKVPLVFVDVIAEQ